MIIFLNGCSSAGKTTIARAIQHLSQKPWLLIGIDTFFHMMPPDYVGFGDKADQGFHFIPEHDELGPLMRIENGDYGKKVVGAVPKVIKTLADEGFDLILDEVIFQDEGLPEYRQALKNDTVYFIGVLCDLDILQERELLRGDRARGLGRDQIGRVHPASRTYDLTVDTTHTSAFQCAKSILDFIEKNPHPKSFLKHIISGPSFEALDLKRDKSPMRDIDLS
jgi:chloramphenicol 3-O phosphotransferase